MSDKTKGAVISLGSVSSKWVAEAMRKYFDQVDEIQLKEIEVDVGKDGIHVLYKEKPIDEYDCIYAKGSFRYTEMLRSISSALSKKCFMPIAPSAFSTGQDKLLTQLRMQQNGVPTPTTYLAATAEAAKTIFEKINYPIVMKFPKGTQGKGVMFADSYASASSMLDALTALKQPFLIQEYVETDGIDIRAIVVGNKVVASMKRKAVEGEKRANIHAGGTGEAYELDNHAKKIAVRAAEALGTGICGVDMLESAKGPLVIELNLSPGLQGITKVTKIDVADKIAKWLYENTKARKKVEKIYGASNVLEELGIKGTDKGARLSKEILTNLDFRGNRILLPEVISNVSELSEKHEVSIKVKKGEILIRKFGEIKK
ncbi:MAG TPA: RimK family alpha-L-glutamate ligase [Candidatus Nanoarchaeia archaeon]|nr:RimK family alpha-L-glutamate ligase [Candidatus Nanoarchaeia archaeon]